MKEFNQLYVLPEFALKLRQFSIKEQISSWLLEEIEYLEKESRMKTFFKQSEGIGEPGIKIQTDFSVAQLAYFLKLLVDSGIIKNSNQKDVIRFFSHNISTKQTETISQTSLNTKYYNYEETNKTVVKDNLIRINNEVNRKT